jgi:hypothetical protein
VNVRVFKNKASITVDFDVTQMNALKSATGIHLDNPNRICRDVLHTWIFERVFTEANWILTNTSSIGK